MRKPKHPLRLIRVATPHATQAAFAAYLGVPAAVVQAVESGKGRMTPRLAALIRERAGADDLELLRGTNGAARSLSGRRYTARAFEDWQGSAQQAEEKTRRELLQSACGRAWMEHVHRAAPHRKANGGPLSAEEITCVEDLVTPWQVCEFASASAAAWKRLPDSLQGLTGWSQELSLPPHRRLTLAVQAAPVWNPDMAPPGFSAANADLFPPCFFTVAAGSGGCRVAAAFWEAVCREHAIDPDNGTPLHEAPTGSWRGFFRRNGDRCEPHAVFAGMEPGEAADWRGGLFSAGGILCGPADKIMAEEVLHFIERHSEDAGSPAGILLFASLEGGTASTLSSLLLSTLRDRFPAVPVMVIGVLPLVGISQAVFSPCHVALAMQAIHRYATLTVLFSNDLLLAQASRIWGLPAPGYPEVNLLIAECLTALTAPLRFGGRDAPPVDFASLLECFPAPVAGGMPIVTGQCWPLAALADRRLKTVTVPALVQSVNKAACRARLLSARAGAAAMFLRVRLKSGSKWLMNDAPPAVHLTGRTGTGLHESASLFAPSPLIGQRLKRLAAQASEVIRTRASRGALAGIPATEEDLRAAIREMMEVS